MHRAFLFFAKSRLFCYGFFGFLSIIIYL